MTEIWKDIAGYEGLYQISNLGRVKSLGNNKSKKDKILEPKTEKYLRVTLRKEGKNERKEISILVAEHFIPVPEHLKELIGKYYKSGRTMLEVNHRDENTHNNSVWINPDGSIDQEKSNLEWCNSKYNNNYGTRNNRIGRKGVRNYKKPIIQYTKSGKYIREWGSAYEAAKSLNICRTGISLCVRGKSKTAGSYIWKYKTEG